MRWGITREKAFYQKVFTIMLPVALQQAINSGVNMVDTMMLGQLGEIPLSASSLANQFYLLFTIVCMGIVGGASVLAAQFWGAGDKERVRETFNLALKLTLLVSLVFTVLTALFSQQIMLIYTRETAVIEQGVRYLSVTVFIFAIHGIGFVAAFLMRTVGNSRLGLTVSVISFFVNIAANYIFIFGRLGAPQMGIAGAALGTLIARSAEFLITVIYVFIIDKTLGLRLRHLRKNPSPPFIKNYLRLGAPVLVSDALLGLGGNMISIVIGHMGSAIVAANAICMVIDRLCTVVIHGVAIASGIVTGNTVGRGEREKAMEQGRTFYLLSIVFGLFGSLMVLLIGPMTIAFYTLTAETAALTRQMMVIYAVIVFFQCIQTVMTKGVLRGGGDTRFLMVADILFLWLVSIPLGAAGGLLFHWPAGLTVICLRIDYLIKSFWCVTRLKSGKWIYEANDYHNQ